MGIDPDIYKQFKREREYLFRHVTQGKPYARSGWVVFFPKEMESVTVLTWNGRGKLDNFLYRNGLAINSNWHPFVANKDDPTYYHGSQFQYAHLI